MNLHYGRARARESCVNGHDLTDPTNVYKWRGVRLCRVCRRMNDRRRLNIPFDNWKIKEQP